jgi:hypothetical protein
MTSSQKVKNHKWLPLGKTRNCQGGTPLRFTPFFKVYPFLGRENTFRGRSKQSVTRLQEGDLVW